MEYLTTYTYNNNGAIASEVSIYKGKERPFRVISYTYDKQGREVERLLEDFHSPDATHMLYKTTYDDAGSKDEIIRLASDDNGSFAEKESGNTGMMIRAGRQNATTTTMKPCAIGKTRA